VGYSVVLGNRKFSSLLVGQIISLLGDVILTAALSLFVFNLTRTATAISYLGIAIVVPNLLFSLFAGVIVDRWNRRRIMIVADLVRCLALFFIPTLYRLGGLTLSLLYVIVFVWSSSSSFFLPARGAIMPQIFRNKDHLASANSLMNGAFEATRLIGLGVSGFFILVFTAIGAAALDSATFLVSALFVLAMGTVASPSRASTKANAVSGFLQDISEGLNYVWKHFVIRVVLISTMLANFFVGIGLGFIVVYAEEALSAGTIGYTGLLTASSVGVVVGSLLVGKVKFRKHLGMTLILASILIGVAIISLSPQTKLSAAIPLTIFFGFCLAIYNVNYINMLQATVPNKMLGRVMSLDQIFSFAILPLSFAIGGPLVDFIGIRTAYLLSGIMIILIGSATFISRKFREYSY